MIPENEENKSRLLSLNFAIELVKAGQIKPESMSKFLKNLNDGTKNKNIIPLFTKIGKKTPPLYRTQDSHKKEAS